MAKKKFLPNKNLSNFAWLHGQEVLTKQNSQILPGYRAKKFLPNKKSLILTGYMAKKKCLPNKNSQILPGYMAKNKILPNNTISNFDWLHGQVVLTKQKLPLTLSGYMAKKNFLPNKHYL